MELFYFLSGLQYRYELERALRFTGRALQAAADALAAMERAAVNIQLRHNRAFLFVTQDLVEMKTSGFPVIGRSPCGRSPIQLRLAPHVGEDAEEARVE